MTDNPSCECGADDGVADLTPIQARRADRT